MIKRDLEFSINYKTPFTNYAVQNQLLSEPFVLVDVGCLGGFGRWENLIRGGIVHAYAFDPQVMSVRTLPNTHYFGWALGAGNGEVSFQVLADPYGSSIRNDVVDRSLDYSHEMKTVVESRWVPMRSLDSLWFDKIIPKRVNLLKLDCEGYEFEVLLGAPCLLQDSEICGIEVETNFNNIRDPYFIKIYNRLASFGYRLVALTNNALPVADFMRRARTLNIEPDVNPVPSVFMALFHRNVGGPVKNAIALEAYGLNDLAYDVLKISGFSDEICDLLIHA